LNIYEMYVFHWKQPGFWISRTTWGNTIAKVTHVGELSGAAPYYGNPEVLADVYDLHTGELKERGFVIDTAGTFKTWRWVQPPEWSEDAPFDPKAGRVLLNVPFAKNKAAKRIGARWSDMLKAWWIPEDAQMVQKAKEAGLFDPVPERLYFEVSYQDRHIPKQAGARWDSRIKLWSLAEDDEEGIDALKQAGYTPIQRKDM